MKRRHGFTAVVLQSAARVTYSQISSLRKERKGTLIIKYPRLSHDVVTCDVDRDFSTAYC